MSLPLRTLRVQAGLSMRGLAQRSGVHYTTIAHIEGGRSQRIHPETRKKLADALGVPVSAVWEFSRDLPATPE